MQYRNGLQHCSIAILNSLRCILHRVKRFLRRGAIPAKYKILMTMIVDAIMAHSGGCSSLADRARAAGASEAEINEAVEVAYLFGGTPALVTAINALHSED